MVSPSAPAAAAAAQAVGSAHGRSAHTRAPLTPGASATSNPAIAKPRAISRPPAATNGIMYDTPVIKAC